ncbi:hypothetical protein PSY31_24100, partial [Shigella flexneri]|nr:hypothetical protein [Shigella flexneri]
LWKIYNLFCVPSHIILEKIIMVPVLDIPERSLEFWHTMESLHIHMESIAEENSNQVQLSCQRYPAQPYFNYLCV